MLIYFTGFKAMKFYYKFPHALMSRGFLCNSSSRETETMLFHQVATRQRRGNVRIVAEGASSVLPCC